MRAIVDLGQVEVADGHAHRDPLAVLVTGLFDGRGMDLHGKLDLAGRLIVSVLGMART